MGMDGKEKGKLLCISGQNQNPTPIETEDAFNFLICPICCDVFSGPVVQCIWGHTFCAECIFQWMGKKSSCPQCRKPITKTNLCRNLLIEQAIEELVLKNFLKAPIKTKAVNLCIPESPEVWNSESKRQMLMKIVGCNFLILAVFFAAVAVFFEEHIRQAQHEVTFQDTVGVTKNATANASSSVEEGHVPISVLMNEVAYYISTGSSVALSFFARKAIIALKIFLSRPVY